MADEEKKEPVTSIVKVSSIYDIIVDEELEAKVNKAVADIIIADDRFSAENVDIETVDAIRDWVRAEAVLAEAFRKFMNKDTTASMERMFRHASLHKNTLRDEIFGKYKGRKAKKDEIDYAKKILVNHGIIEPKQEVDQLEDE